MLAFALISLFALTSVVVVLSLSDSALRGARAFKQLSSAVRDLKNSEVEPVCDQPATIRATQPAAITRVVCRAPDWRSLPAAA